MVSYRALYMYVCGMLVSMDLVYYHNVLLNITPPLKAGAEGTYRLTRSDVVSVDVD